MLSLTICSNAKSIRSFQQWPHDDGNSDCTIHHRHDQPSHLDDMAMCATSNDMRDHQRRRTHGAQRTVDVSITFFIEL